MENSNILAPAMPLPKNDKQGITPSNLRFPVVGLGASAGGISALLRFFENMPPDNGMAFVVILHLSPTHESSVAGILQGATAMKVEEVSAQTAIEKNHVYVISPNSQLRMDDSHLGVQALERPLRSHASIDIFFRTLAEVHGDRAFGIVLSGTGADGAVGLARIKEMGGITFAQLPADAEHDGMPRSAIEAGIVDFVLPVSEMPKKLIQLWDNARSLCVPPTDNADVPVTAPVISNQAAEEALQEILLLLRRHTGHDFRHYKRGTVIRRIERRMQVRAIPDFPAYRDFLKAKPAECDALLQDLLIGVTNFFRDQEVFEALERQVIPALFAEKREGERVRAWVTACSTGEEAYSLAIMLAEYIGARPSSHDFQVFATDIDERAIAAARAGLYPLSIETDVSAARLRQFFGKEDRHYRVKKSLRDKLLFAPQDLLKDSPFSKLDLISCRNLMIYLNTDVQIRLLELFHFALNPGGYLLLGNVESADAMDHLFTPVDKKNRIYRAKPLATDVKNVPSLPIGPATRTAIPRPNQPARKMQLSFAQLHQRALAQFASPSVMVDRDSNIVHISDNAGRFLRYIGGEPSRNLPSLVLPQLRLELRTTLFQAFQSRKSAQAPRVRLERDGQGCYVDMVAHPFHDTEVDADFVLVMFSETTDAGEGAAPSEGAKNTVLTQLEEELHRTKEQLQETIERAEVSAEEYKASNEELQAINEELRSATEELETSKEELQSVNEELMTVNYELKAKVEEASKVNDDLNNLIASTDIATVFVDASIRIKRYTPAAANIFNIIPADIGRSLLDITHRLDYVHLADDAAATFESLVPIEREVRSNDNRHYIVRMLPYRTTDDRIGGAVLTFIDITSRHQAEERVKASERRIQLFAESTKDYAIITADADGSITNWNKGAERIFGYTEEEAAGKNLSVIFTPEDIAAGVPQEELQQARKEGRVEDERWHVCKDGSRRFCSSMLTPLENSEFFGYAKILKDVTERRREEQQRDAQMAKEKAGREDAQAENMLKDQFLAVMSHELKQPLNLIHINAEVLMRLPEVRKSVIGAKATDIIRRTTLSQAKIIDDLLDLSRLSTGKLTLSLSDIDFTAVVNSISEVAQVEAQADGVQLTVRGTEQPIIIRADQVRVEQVIWNLINNAIKFTPAGGRIAIDVVRENGQVRLDVTDTGQGIAPEFLPYVFDIYKQASPAARRTKGGLGIGLSLVKQLISLHGGRVEVASDGQDRGAKFSIWLPVEEMAAVDGMQDMPAPAPNIAGLRILLIDDLEEVVSALKSLLEFEHAAVFTATDAESALKILSGNDIDLIVSDVAMPGTDGYDFIRKVRGQPKGRDVPAIAVTGMGRQADVEQAMQAGFSAHISKPISIETLSRKLAELGIRTPEPGKENVAGEAGSS